ETLLSEQTASSAGRSATYTPLEGQRYVWKRGQEVTETWVGTKTSEEWFGFIPGIEGGYDDVTYTPGGAPVDLPDGQYVDGGWQSYGSICVREDHSINGRVGGGQQQVSVCEGFDVYGWWVGKTLYAGQDTYKCGSQGMYAHSVVADYDIPNEFIG